MMRVACDWNELSSQVIATFGHFLWQACMIALVLHFAMSRRLSAHVRYNLACTAFFTLPLCVVATFGLVHHSRGRSLFQAVHHFDPRAATVDSREPTPYSAGEMPAGTTPALASPRADSAPLAQPTLETAGAAWSQRRQESAPYLMIAYAAGVGVMLVRFALSILGSSRLRKTVQPITDSKLVELIATLATRLQLRRVPLVALCPRISVPMVVGIVKPIILLPPALVCGLEPTQVAAILAHEMAHIRRCDLIVNLFQRLVEAFLFFHPLTWWLSRRVSIERENSCDDAAAGCMGRLPYADALLQMASLCVAGKRDRHAALATLSADGGNVSDFGSRIRRLLDAPETTRVGVTWRSVAGGFTLLALLTMSWAAWGQPRRDDGIQWSTWGDKDGLFSGARLILPEGGLRAGQPLVVEYRLANVSKERKTFKGYLTKAGQWVALGRDHCLRGDLDWNGEPNTLTLEPGEVFVDSAHRVSIDTTGMEPGEYQVALGSAFHYPDEANPRSTHEIPHRGRISFTLAGESKTTLQPLPSNDIHWGKPIAGLQLGARFVGAPRTFAIGQTIQADLFIANATNRPIECSLRLPHPADGWLFNVENQDGDTIMLQRPPLISIPHPQQFFALRLAPGEVRALTDQSNPTRDEEFAGPRAKWEIADSEVDEATWSDHTIQGRLVTRGGNYSAIFEVQLDHKAIPGVRVSLDSGNVSFTVASADKSPLPANAAARW
ncbi:MAG: M56 family metallopeptidase [Pirellulales bacterium]